MSEFNPLAPYINFIELSKKVAEKKAYDCDKLASDVFGGNKALNMQNFFKTYFMKVGASEEQAQDSINKNKDLLTRVFRMFVGPNRKLITKDLFLNKLKKDGICPTVQIMPKKSGYQMQDETQTCGIQNKNNMLTILAIILILLAIFYLLNKKKK
jgi:LPXTG-motif cell wall-anchored protein